VIYALPIAIVLAVYFAHLFRKQRQRKRITRWAANRSALGDDAFYAALDLPSISKKHAVLVRATISDAVQIPKELIAPSDRVAELEKVGDPSHPTTIDFLEDVLRVTDGETGSTLMTVRDFVIEFAPQLKQWREGSKRDSSADG
jgi:hypothetical protein